MSFGSESARAKPRPVSISVKRSGRGIRVLARGAPGAPHALGYQRKLAERDDAGQRAESRVRPSRVADGDRAERHGSGRGQHRHEPPQQVRGRGQRRSPRTSLANRRGARAGGWSSSVSAAQTVTVSDRITRAVNPELHIRWSVGREVPLRHVERHDQPKVQRHERQTRRRLSTHPQSATFNAGRAVSGSPGTAGGDGPHERRDAPQRDL
jgi:hypothetical protein